MMTGEFELDAYFHWNETKEDFGQVSAQVFYIVFLVFVSIVIANLLIGLTVSKTDELFKEAGTVRLEKTANLVAHIETIFQSQSQASWLNPLFWLKKLNRKGKLWQHGLWSFQGRDTKLERFLAKNQLHSNEIIEFYKLV